MPDVTRQPILRYFAGSAVAGSESFAAVGVMGAAYIVNNGPNPVWLSFDALPVAGAYGDGRKRLAMGESLNLDDIVYTSIGFICAAAQTADVEIVGLIRSGNSGQGVG
jgi:hypothetical protein